MRKTGKLLLCLVMCIMVYCVSIQDHVWAEDSNIESGSCGENLTWEFTNETGILDISGSGSMTNYTSAYNVPWYNFRNNITTIIIDDGVTSIGDYAFYYCRSLNSISIPGGISYIGKYSFGYCSNLISINIPSAVTKIENGTFYNCSALTNVIIPAGVTGIGDSAFYNCSNLNSVLIPQSVTSVGSSVFYGCDKLTDAGPVGENWHIQFAWNDALPNYAFSGCSALTEISIPQSIKSVGNSAFSGCTKLQTVIIPVGATSIGRYAFSGCSALSSVTIPASVTTMGESVFSDCSSLLSAGSEDGNNIVFSWTDTIPDNAFKGSNKLTSLVIPEGVSAIGKYAFQNCSVLSKVVIPSTVTTIGANPFYGCKTLTCAGPGEDNSIIFGWNDSIPNNAFSYCGSLTSVDIPDSITNIGEYAFYECSNLINITLPNSITNIGRFAFYNCKAITALAIPEGAISIGDYAFSGCSTLQKINLPASLTNVGEGVFGDCDKLNTAGLTGGDYNIEFAWTATIPENAFSDCNSLISITLPETIQSINNNAFSDCSGLRQIDIPNQVKAIGDSAFYRCISLSSIIIPEKVVTVGSSAFYGCELLSRVTLFKSLKSIEWYAFDGCSALSEVYFDGYEGLIERRRGDGWSNSHNDALYNATWHCKQIEDGWGLCGDDLIWKYETTSRLLTIKGDGAMWGWTEWEAAPWSEYSGMIVSATIQTGVKDIGKCAFYECNRLQSITLPEGLVTIGDEAFNSCTALKTVVMPSSVRTIGEYAFYNCNSLGQITISNGITKIGKGAFSYCTSLTSVSIPQTVTSLEDYTFSDCSSLASIVMPKSLTKIGARAFSECSSLTSIAIPQSVISIGEFAFYDCESLSEITIGEGLKNIGECAFSWCQNLSNVIFRCGSVGIRSDSFNYVVAKSYYPDNGSWWASDFQNYGGTLTWIPYNTLYNVKYNANGGKNAPAATIKADGEALTLSETQPTRSGFIFKGWATGASATAAKYQPGGTYSADQNVTLYAVWGPKTPVVTKSLNADNQPALSWKALTSAAKYEIYRSATGKDGSFKLLDTVTDLSYSDSSSTAGQTFYYKVRAVTEIGVKGEFSTVQTVTTKPAITTQPKNLTASEGDTASFTIAATGTDLTYQWQYRTSAEASWSNTTADGNKTTSLKVSATTQKNGYQYRCAVKNAAGTVYSAIVTLTVKATKAVITTQPQNATATEGGTAKFTVKATGTGLTYQWQFSKDGTSWSNITSTAYTGVKTATLTVPATLARNGYQFRCAVKNTAGTVYSKAATLTVTAKAVITTQPKSITAAAGETAKFTVKASGTGLTYQWQYRSSSSGTWKSATATGNKTATLQVPVTAKKDGYQYRCKIKNAAGTVTTNIVTLTVAAKPTITTQPKSITAAAGETAKFTVKASGTGLTYQWQYRTSSSGTWKSATATGNKTATLQVPVTAKKDGYQYRCKIKNSAGTVTTKAVTLTVAAKPAITTQPKDVTAAAGETAKFTVKATGTGLTYQWQYRTSASGSWQNCSSKTKGYNTATLQVEATAKRSGYQYRCVITNSAGKVTTKAATLTVQ